MEYKILILLSTLTAAVLVVVFSIISIKMPAENSLYPNQYRAYAIVLFQEGGGSSNVSTMLSAFGVESPGSGASASQLALEILRSRSFIDSVVKQFNIIERFDIKEKYQTKSRGIILENSEYTFNRDSGAMNIAFTHIDPAFAADLVNYEVNLLEEWFLDKGVSLQSYELSQMEEKLNELTSQISIIEEDIEAFQKEHGVLDIMEIATAQSAMLTDLRTRLNQVELEIRDYSEYSTIEDPALIILNNQRYNIINQINRIEGGYTGSDGRKMPSLEELPQLSLKFTHMQAELSIKNQLYQTLSERFEVTKLVASGGGVFSVLEYAEIPEEKTGPSRGRLCMMVTFGTFAGAIVLALIINMIKNIAGDPVKKKILKKGRDIKSIVFVVFSMVCFSLSAQQFTMPGSGDDEATGDPIIQYIPQAIIPVQAVPDVADNLQLAISNRQYPVTPGDIYTLTFLLAGETVSNVLLVESDYTINMTIFGKLNALGMNFAQLKPVIEQKIADAYPRSLPSLTITSVGVFQVPISGEIPQSRYVTAWGLSRLSEVLEGNLGDYSSVRDIKIISVNEDSQTYDLLMALNQGNLSQNPTIRPDDRIIINRIHREIQVLGEVYKPGTYQLLDNEGIADVEKYTGGFTPMANTSRIRIDRYSGNHGSSFFMNQMDYRKDFEIHNGDIITIPSIIRIQPVVYVEGGISGQLGIPAADTTLFDEYDRVVYPVNEGETLYDILDSLRDSIAPFADLENGYVIRDSLPIPVNMQNLIYNYKSYEDIILEPFDHIVIPVKRPTVYVTGAANFPGPFPYNPHADYLYYVNQAGGFDYERNNNGKVIITDMTGTRRKLDDPIQPGDTVNVLSNNFLYNFNQYFPAIATGLGLIITMITIANALNQNTTP